MPQLGTPVHAAAATGRKHQGPGEIPLAFKNYTRALCGWHREFGHLFPACTNGTMSAGTPALAVCLWDNLMQEIVVWPVWFHHEAPHSEAGEPTTPPLVSYDWPNGASGSRRGSFQAASQDPKVPCHCYFLKFLTILRVGLGGRRLGFCRHSRLASLPFPREIHSIKTNKDRRERGQWAIHGPDPSRIGSGRRPVFLVL